MAATTTRRTPRARKTREETQQEMNIIQQEVAITAATRSAPERAAQAAHADEVREATKGIEVEALVHRLSALGLEVSQALNGLSNKLVGEANLLMTLREAAELESKRLAELHQIDVAASSIEQLVADYERKRQELEAEHEQAEARFAAEQAAHGREQKEYEESLKKLRQRERDDYEYQKALERKREQDAYEQKSAALERSLKEKREALEKEWREREAELATAEGELEGLRKESVELPKRLEREIAKAVAEAVKAAEQKGAQELVLVRKEMEGERRVAELRVQTLEAALTRQQADAEALQRKLDEATRQVQEVALKAIEGASGAQALQHVNKIAMEQAKKPQG